MRPRYRRVNRGVVSAGHVRREKAGVCLSTGRERNGDSGVLTESADLLGQAPAKKTEFAVGDRLAIFDYGGVFRLRRNLVEESNDG